MKQITTGLLVLILFTPNLLAQQVELKGQVMIMNSRTSTGTMQYVKGASVIAAFATPDDTDEQGRFNLVFAGIPSGQSVKVSVQKPGYEVVNSYDLEDVVLGRTTDLKVYLSLPQHLADEQMKLYHISDSAFAAEKDKIIAQLYGTEAESKQAIKKLEEELNTIIADKFEAEQLLIKKYNELKDKLPEYSQKLARINLDFASELYISAYAKFKLGKIKEVIHILESSDPSKRVDEVISKNKQIIMDQQKLDETLKSNLEETRILIDERFLAAQNYELDFRFTDAIAAYEDILRMMEGNKVGNDLELADVYTHLAQVYSTLKQSKKAVDHQLKAIEICAEFNAVFMKEIDINGTLFTDRQATNYNNLAVYYLELKDYPNAINAVHKALEMDTTLHGIMHEKVGSEYNNLAAIYQSIGKNEEALKCIEMALAIDTVVHPRWHINITKDLNNMSAILADLGRYEDAIAIMSIVLSRDNQMYEENDPVFIRHYFNTGAILMELKDYVQAFNFFAGAVYVDSLNYGPYSYNTINLCNRAYEAAIALEDTALALIYLHKSLDADEHLSGGMSTGTALAHYNLANIYKDIGNYDMALKEIHKAISINQLTLPQDHFGHIKSNISLSAILSLMDRPYQALEVMNNAYEMGLRIVEPGSEDMEFLEVILGWRYVAVGDSLVGQKLYRQALENFEEALKLDTANAQAFNRAGLAAYYLQDQSKALQYYEEAYRLDEELIFVYLNNSGMAYLKAGDTGAAKKQFEQLRQLTPDVGGVYRNMGALDLVLNNYNQALSNFTKAIDLGYKNCEWFRTDELLDPYRERKDLQDIISEACKD